jgi:hypothetical protein
MTQIYTDSKGFFVNISFRICENLRHLRIIQKLPILRASVVSLLIFMDPASMFPADRIAHCAVFATAERSKVFVRSVRFHSR